MQCSIKADVMENEHKYYGMEMLNNVPYYKFN